MSGRTMSPARLCSRGGALVLALGAMLSASGALAQTHEPGEGWERIGDTRRSQFNVSFAPNGILWANTIGLDTLDVRNDPQGAWRVVARSGYIDAPVFFVSPDTLLVPAAGNLRRSNNRGRTFENLSQSRLALYVPPTGAAYPSRVQFGSSELAAYSDDRGTTFVTAVTPNDSWAYAVRAWASMPAGAGPWGAGPSVQAGRMFAASGRWGLCYSDDGGASWTPTGLWGTNLLLYHVTVLARPPEQGGGLRVVVMGLDNQATTATQVWTSDDGGATFARTATIEDPAPQGFWSVVALLPVVPGMASGPNNPVPTWTTSEALAVTTRGGIYRTTDGGLTWPQIPGPAGRVSLLPDDVFHSVRLAVLGPDGRLYPVTRRTGPIQEWQMRSTTRYAPVASEAPPAPASVASVGPVVPNPASGRARLALGLPAASRVTVDLFDAVGRLVRGGVEVETAAGTSAVDLDLSGLAPGVYVARVTVRSAGAPTVVSRRFTVTR